MSIKHSNFFTTTLSAGIGTGDTSCSCADISALVALGGSDWVYLVLDRADGTGREIVKVNAHDGATEITDMDRSQDGTSALSFSAGDAVKGSFVRASLEDSVSVPTLTMGTPTGSSTSKTVQMTVNKTGYHRINWWLVDVNDASSPETAFVPDGQVPAASSGSVITDNAGTNQHTLTFTHTGAQRSWYLCAECAGEVFISSVITIGM